MAEDPIRQLDIKPLDVDKFIKVNELKAITNPMFFARTNMPTVDGLLSNEIFGITKDDRTTIFAYIDLAGEYFLHPLAYKIWSRLDSNVKLCVYEMDTFVYDPEKGKLKSDPKGETGLKFLMKLIKTVDFKKTGSSKREVKINFLEKYREKLFMKDVVVIPAGMRDVNTEADGKVGVGEINKLYNAIVRDAKALQESDDYGLSLNGTLRGRIQDNIVKIYNWFIFGRDPLTGADAQASGLSRKLGLIRRAGMKKSFDWGSRLVICTQNLRKEKLSDLDVDLDSIGLPLAAVCANLFPYMLYWIRNWFSNRLSDVQSLTVYNTKTKKLEQTKIDSWQTVYSDERIKKEIGRFMHGMSNRFVPIEAPIMNPTKGTNYYLQFKGYNVPNEDIAKKLINDQMSKESFHLNSRPLTWCDLIYMAAMEVTKDKMTLITRFPMDSYYNQFPAKIKVISTIETEPILVWNTFYKKYPKITLADINQNSSNHFVDVALPNNVRLGSIGGDFDGDTVSSKVPYSIEANDELYKAINAKIHYIGFGGINKMETSHEGAQAIYNITMNLPDDDGKFTDPEF
jgi:hypothetical protein